MLVVMFTALNFFSSCLTSTQMDRFVAEQYSNEISAPANFYYAFVVKHGGVTEV